MNHKYRANYDGISWVKKAPKTFQTSWGAEYTLRLPVEEEDKPDWMKYNSPTIKDLVEKSKREKK